MTSPKILSFAAILTLQLAQPIAARRIDDGGVPTPDCEEGLNANLRIEATGYPLKGGTIGLSASLSKIILIGSNCYQLAILDIPAGVPFSWSVTAPVGANATLTDTSTLAPKLTLPVSGDYKIRFTLCPGGCAFPVGGRPPMLLADASTEITIKAVDAITIPPEHLPVVPQFAKARTEPTYFPWEDRQVWCQYGGGTLDPQWVTVNDWNDASDYVFLEGVVQTAHIAYSDSYPNHDSADFNFSVRPDLRHTYLVSTDPEYSNDPFIMGVEWEWGSFPEHVWPSIGDRVSVFGYWIFDCGHEPYYTEIHPPAGVAVQRPRAVRIPDGAQVTYDCPPRAPFNGPVGSNVWVPGIVTEIWFNNYPGEITSNCSWTGLHQKGRLVPDPAHPGRFITVDGSCIEGDAPLRREFEFNIFLPRNPQLLAAEAGFSKPPVPLYLNIAQIASLPGGGQPGPDPVVELVPRSATNDFEYLRVRLDLRGFTGDSYSRRITAAWVYPDVDNWSLKNWRVALPSMDVHDDGDGNYIIAQDDGDWHFFLNVQNTYQEWSRIFDCGGCVHGHENFSPPWATGASDSFFFRSLGSSDPTHRLGPDLALYPGERIRIQTCGLESDPIFDDDTGRVVASYGQLEQDASPLSFGEDAEYTLNLQIREGPPVNRATLSSDARTCIADVYRLSNGFRPPFRLPELAGVFVEDVNPGLSPGCSARRPWKEDGEQAGALLGQSVSTAGDINGDGFPDLLIGAPKGGGGRQKKGVAFLYLGHRNGISSEPSWTGTIDREGAAFGSAVAAAGDVNSDGFADVVIGAPSYDNNNGGVVPLPPGRAFLFLGSPDGLSTTPDWQSSGAAGFGASVAGVGDVNGDGYSDVVIGSPGATVLSDKPGQGAAFLFLGSDSGLPTNAAWGFLGEIGGALLGWSVAGAGDVNGDGLADVIIGAPEHSPDGTKRGKVYLFLGQKTAAGLSIQPAWTHQSTDVLARHGTSASGAGDVNGDGIDDIIVGSPGYFFDDVQTELGRADLFFGVKGKIPSQQPAWTFSGPGGGSQLGTVVGSAGDIDGDGFGDVFLSAPGATLGYSGEGVVYTFLGGSKGPGRNPACVFAGEQANAKFGVGAASAGDVDRDGFADIIVGAPHHDSPLDTTGISRDPSHGRVRVEYGWGPKEVDIIRVHAFEPADLEPHTLVDMPLPELAGLFATRGSDAGLIKLHASLLDLFAKELQGSRRLDMIDELAALHAAFPPALWEQYFGAYQLFRRGDANTDRKVDLSDGVQILIALFTGGTLACLDAADSNDDGKLDISDAIAIFGYLFTGANGAPPYPFEEEGLDPTSDAIGCERY